MGRHNHSGRVRQRSQLVANREERHYRSRQAFSLYRTISAASFEPVYEVVQALQMEDDIPAAVSLHQADIHSPIIQERRVRQGLINNKAGGFTLLTALKRIQTKLPQQGNSSIVGKFCNFDVVGPKRQSVIGIVRDSDPATDALRAEPRIVKHVLATMKSPVEVDGSRYVTLGTCAEGMSATQRELVISVLGDTIGNHELEFEPVTIEQNGTRYALHNASQIVLPPVGNAIYPVA